MAAQEAMGTGGPSLLFRASPDSLGQWMLRTWAAVVPYAAGSVVAQDVFRAGLINSDTDFRCVSARLWCSAQKVTWQKLPAHPAA